MQLRRSELVTPMSQPRIDLCPFFGFCQGK
jgi:hypothetical protein